MRAYEHATVIFYDIEWHTRAATEECDRNIFIFSSSPDVDDRPFFFLLFTRSTIVNGVSFAHTHTHTSTHVHARTHRPRRMYTLYARRTCCPSAAPVRCVVAGGRRGRVAAAAAARVRACIIAATWRGSRLLMEDQCKRVPGRPYKWRSSVLKRRRASHPTRRAPPPRPRANNASAAVPLIVLLHSAFRCQPLALATIAAPASAARPLSLSLSRRLPLLFFFYYF